MKILCVIDSLCAGGAQRQLIELALGFKEKLHQVSFLTYHNITFYKPILDKSEITVTCIEEPNYLFRLLKMRAFIRQGKYDTVISFLEAANFICEFSGLPFRKWRLIVGERNADPEISRSIRLKMYRWFHIFADYIVANSSANIRLVKRVNPFLKLGKCEVIYNIVDFKLFNPENQKTARKDSRINLIVAARLEYQKNLLGLVDALIMLNDDQKSKIKINWYGEVYENQSNRYNEYIQIAFEKIRQNKLGDIISFHPACQNINILLQESDAVGLFSLFEGLPNIICEAMASAKPVICSNVSDISLLISYDRNLLFDPADPRSIKDAIIYLMNLSSEQLIQIGSTNEAIAKKMFDREEILSKYLQLMVA